MWKSSLPSKLFLKYSSSRRLQSSETMDTLQVDSSRDDTALSVGNMHGESSSISRRLSLRRLSLPTVSHRPQWGKRLQQCMSHRVIKQRKNSNQTDGEGHSLSLTNSSEEDSSIKSNLSTSSSSSSSSAELSMKQHPRSVRFSVVQVREFDRTVGENPACKAGPPLTLDWSFVERPDEWLFDISDDDGEDSTTNDNKQTTKRTLQQLHVSAERRIALLRDEWDVTESELEASMLVVDQIKKSREKVVTEFRQMIAFKRQQQEVVEQRKVRQQDDESNAEFLVTRVEC